MSQRTNPTPVALYARVSSERQDVDLSVSAQLRALRDFAEKNGRVAVCEYVDEAMSGRIANRPKFREMLDATKGPNPPFQEILVWKLSRFTRKREDAVVLKAMLRRRGIKVTSITEPADDSPMGRMIEGIIETVDEFYTENMAQEIIRGMRESASRGSWLPNTPPYGYLRVHVQDGAKKRPRLVLNPPDDGVVKRMFDMAASGRSLLDIARTLDGEGITTARGKHWGISTIQRLLRNEAYTGTLIWGVNAKDGAPPVRVEGAFDAIVTREQFDRVARMLSSKHRSVMHPRRVASSHLLSGLVKCKGCGMALTVISAKSGQYHYYVCLSLAKRGKGACEAPRLNSKDFEKLIIEQVREHILTESNVRNLVRLVDDEMDGVAREEGLKQKSIQKELADVRRSVEQLWRAVETSELEGGDIAPRLRQHHERQELLEHAAAEARALLVERRTMLESLETVTTYVQEMSDFLQTSDRAASKAFIRSFIKKIVVKPKVAIIHYTIPTPPDSPIGGGAPVKVGGPNRGGDPADVGLGDSVLPTVHAGGDGGNRTHARRIKSPLARMPCRAARTLNPHARMSLPARRTT